MSMQSVAALRMMRSQSKLLAKGDKIDRQITRILDGICSKLSIGSQFNKEDYKEMSPLAKN